MSAPYKTVSTDKAPSAIGPYSQATVHNGIIYCSGCESPQPAFLPALEPSTDAYAPTPPRHPL